MKNSKLAIDHDDDLAPRSLDLRRAVRGKYYGRAEAGTNVVLIAPDLLDTFPDSQAVNEALRTLKRLKVKPAAPARRKQRSSAAS
jgi:hypothetical protein